MTRSEHQQSSGRPIWVPRTQAAGQSVETLQLRSGATLILSRFDPGERQSFCFTEPEDNFGFGFHLKGGAQFELENGPFETRCWDVWSVASPQGSTSNFVLPAEGFATVSIRFKPEVADAFFADGLGLPDSARPLLERVSEEVGSVRLQHLSPAAAWRLQSMFSTPYGDTARLLYLESSALELLAECVASHARPMGNARRIAPDHRDKAFVARECLDRHLRNPPTIAELSKHVGTNEFTLKRAFKETHGKTIFAYVSMRRMEYAMSLLDQGMSNTSYEEAVGSEALHHYSGQYPKAINRRRGLDFYRKTVVRSRTVLSDPNSRSSGHSVAVAQTPHPASLGGAGWNPSQAISVAGCRPPRDAVYSGL